MTTALQRVTVGALVVLMMLAVGLRVTPATMLAVARRRTLIGRVLLANVVVVPLAGLAITSLLGASPAVGAAMLLCAAVPGGPLGPVLAGLAAADLPLAAGVMVVLALTSVATTPVVAALVIPDLNGMHIETLPVLVTVLSFQLLPLGVGMAVALLSPRLAGRLALPAATAANLLLGALVIGLVATRLSLLAALDARSLIAMTTFVAATIVIGDRLGDTIAERHTLALSTGVRNLALALLLSDRYLASPAVDAAPLCFAVVMLGLPTVTALAWRRHASKVRTGPRFPDRVVLAARPTRSRSRSPATRRCWRRRRRAG